MVNGQYATPKEQMSGSHFDFDSICELPNLGFRIVFEFDYFGKSAINNFHQESSSATLVCQGSVGVGEHSVNGRPEH
jgi:hypothetical protein